MICCRCGYCCRYYAVVIVDDPEKPFNPDNEHDVETNTCFHIGDGKPCKHLRGDKPGEYSCAVHDKPWYKQTPCWRHGQIEKSSDCNCRLGEYFLKEIQNGNGRVAEILLNKVGG